MPTPRSHGGAELEKLPLNLPAFMGLNTQIDGALLGNEWATVLKNTVIDDGNRVTSRQGWVPVSDYDLGPGFGFVPQLYEHISPNGSSTLFATSASANVGIWRSTDNGTTWVGINSGTPVVDYDLQFLSFNDELYAFQQGGEVLKYNGVTFVAFNPPPAATFTGTIAQSRVALSAFGRIWAVDDTGYNVQASGLYDDARWDYDDPASDAYLIDLRSVWKNTDTIVALAEFNGRLAIFGKNNILIYGDASGSEMGLNPFDMVLEDTLGNIGCIARDSVHNVDGDLWFLSNSGLMSLTRRLQDGSNPLQNLSYNVQGDILDRIASTNHQSIRAVYSQEERFYLLSFPTYSIPEQGVAYCFDTRGKLEDGSARCVGEWTSMVPHAFQRQLDGRLLLSAGAVSGEEEEGESITTAIGAYGGYSDPRNQGSDPQVPYLMEYESGWNNYESPYIKIPKRLRSIVYSGSLNSLIFKIWYDFATSPHCEYAVDVGEDLTLSEWGVDVGSGGAEWDLGTSPFFGEWGTGLGPSFATVSGVGGDGEYVRLGLSVNITGSPVSIQEIALYLKQGRLT